MQIDFTTTAMIRPQILRSTYASFSKNLKGIDFSVCRLFINIDPLPVGDPLQVVTVAKKFFGKVEYNIAKTDCFAAAVKWCWSQPTTEYIFNLEDDWNLMQPVDINDLIRLLNDDKYYQVVLRAYPNQSNLSLAPSLIKREMYQAYAKKFATDINPEVQMKKQRGICWLEGESPILPQAALIYPGHAVLRDIGRPWMRRTIYKHGPGFLRWEKK